MLVLSRKVGQKIVINGEITITVTAIGKKKIRLGVEAPREVKILRTELREKDSPEK